MSSERTLILPLPLRLLISVVAFIGGLVTLSSILQSNFDIYWKGLIMNVIEGYRSLIHPLMDYLTGHIVDLLSEWLVFEFPEYTPDYLSFGFMYALTNFKKFLSRPSRGIDGGLLGSFREGIRQFKEHNAVGKLILIILTPPYTLLFIVFVLISVSLWPLGLIYHILRKVGLRFTLPLYLAVFLAFILFVTPDKISGGDNDGPVLQRNAVELQEDAVAHTDAVINWLISLIFSLVIMLLANIYLL